MGHRHCEIEGCHELATEEIGVKRDAHNGRFTRWEGSIWTCHHHVADGVVRCANRLLDGGPYTPKVKVVDGSSY